MSPSDLGVFVLSTRGAAADQAGGSNTVKGNTVAAVKQAVCTGVRNLRVSLGFPYALSPSGLLARTAGVRYASSSGWGQGREQRAWTA